MRFSTDAIITATNKAARSAINKTLRKARTASSRQVRQTYMITASMLNRYSRITPATNDRLEGTFQIRSKRLSLITFGARQKRSWPGATIKIRRKEARKLIRHAFIQQASNATHVWMRQGKRRYPLRLLRTLSPTQMFRAEGQAVFEDVAAKEMPGAFEHELMFFTRGIRTTFAGPSR